MEWMKLSEYNLPPQGLKILCFKKGDCWVAYRYNYKNKSIWLPCVPHESVNPHLKYKIVTCDEPDYWCHIPFDQLPGKYTGRMMLKADGDEKLHTLDEFQVTYPKEHDTFIKEFIFALNTQEKIKRGKGRTQSS